jgi:hypothetical protein
MGEHEILHRNRSYEEEPLLVMFRLGNVCINGKKGKAIPVTDRGGP